MKQIVKLWKYRKEPKPDATEDVQECDQEDRNVQHVSCEYQELTEPHLIPPPEQPPEHLAAIKCRVEEFLGQNVEFQDSGAEAVYDLQHQLSKMAARGAEALRRLRDAEEALARQTQKQNLDQLSLIRLEEENARLVAKVNMQERAWQEKFHRLKCLNNILLREREKAWEVERAALKEKIASLQKHRGKIQKTFQKRTMWIKRIAKRSRNGS